MRTKLNVYGLTGIEHQLKTWPSYFGQIENNEKLFEVRKNDRDFQVGDLLILQEYDPWHKKYTGAEIYCEVSSVLSGLPVDDPVFFGISQGYCVMGIKKITGVVINKKLLK